MFKYSRRSNKKRDLFAEDKVVKTKGTILIRIRDPISRQVGDVDIRSDQGHIHRSLPIRTK